MRINLQNGYTYNYYTPSFGVNLNSKKLRFKEEDFYVRIKGYGHHSGWAQKVIDTADRAVKFIRDNSGFEEVLKNITAGITEANQLPLDIAKRMHTGILRTARAGWRHGSDWTGYTLITPYGNSKNKYKAYSCRLDNIANNPIVNPYNDIQLSRPKYDDEDKKYIEHASHKYIKNAFKHVKNIYDNLFRKYIKNEVKTDDLSEINSSVAEIRWILAHATPWERGSDAISNTFIRSIYKSIGIKTSPLKKGISLDLEAYCTNLEDYKKNFPEYFVKVPYIVE